MTNVYLMKVAISRKKEQIGTHCNFTSFLIKTNSESERRTSKLTVWNLEFVHDEYFLQCWTSLKFMFMIRSKSIEYITTIVFGTNVSAIWKSITDICAQNDCFSALSFSNNKTIFFYAKSNIWCRQTSLWISKVITE